MTDRCKSITLPQTSFAGGKKCIGQGNIPVGCVLPACIPYELQWPLPYVAGGVQGLVSRLVTRYQWHGGPRSDVQVGHHMSVTGGSRSDVQVGQYMSVAGGPRSDVQVGQHMSVAGVPGLMFRLASICQ